MAALTTQSHTDRSQTGVITPIKLTLAMANINHQILWYFLTLYRIVLPIGNRRLKIKNSANKLS